MNEVNRPPFCLDIYVFIQDFIYIRVKWYEYYEIDSHSQHENFT